jgi:hypothetical protein
METLERQLIDSLDELARIAAKLGVRTGEAGLLALRDWLHAVAVTAFDAAAAVRRGDVTPRPCVAAALGVTVTAGDGEPVPLLVDAN